MMKQHNIGALLVVDGTRLFGIFTERDALFRVLAEGRDPHTTRLGEVMTSQPQTIHPDEPFLNALRIMHKGRFRHLPVVEFERPLGMVSVRDALDDDLLCAERRPSSSRKTRCTDATSNRAAAARTTMRE